MLPVVYRRRAQQDLVVAFDWFEEQRAQLGDEFLEAVQSTFRTIELYPEMFAVVHDEVRRAIVPRFPFAVFYLVEPRRTVVLRVLHTARNPALWPAARRRVR